MGIPEPVEDGDGFRFLISLDMSRVTSKYMRVGYVNEEGKTCPPRLISMPDNNYMYRVTQALLRMSS